MVLFAEQEKIKTEFLIELTIQSSLISDYKKESENNLTLESTQMIFWIHGKTLYYTRGF